MSLKMTSSFLAQKKEFHRTKMETRKTIQKTKTIKPVFNINAQCDHNRTCILAKSTDTFREQKSIKTTTMNKPIKNRSCCFA